MERVDLTEWAEAAYGVTQSSWGDSEIRVQSAEGSWEEAARNDEVATQEVVIDTE